MGCILFSKEGLRTAERRWIWITPLSGRPAVWNGGYEKGRGGLLESNFSIGTMSERLFANSNLVVIHKGKKLVGQQNVTS